MLHACGRAGCFEILRPTQPNLIPMNTERSFADRLQRAWQLHAALTTFMPAFVPPNAALLPATFADFLESLAELNLNVNSAEMSWKEGSAARLALVKDLQNRALLALSRVKSNAAWKQQVPMVKSAADHLRGYRAATQPLPPDAPAEEKPRTTQVNQSFGDVKVLLDKLIEALKWVPNYDTGVPVGISLSSLLALSTQLDGLNKLMAGKEQSLAAARAPRSLAYDLDQPPRLCLRSQMLAIKEAVKSQYGGTKSPEYLQVKSIKV